MLVPNVFYRAGRAPLVELPEFINPAERPEITDQDSTNPAEQIDRLDKTLTAAGVRHRTEVYTGAHHGFTQADTAMRSPQATERHWTALLELFGRTLTP